MKRFRKGELKFYLTSTPKEIKQYLKDNPDNTEYVEEFLKVYIYNYVKKGWKKK